MIRHSQVDVGDVTLHVAEAGPATAPAFLFLHGWPESWRIWQPILELAGDDQRLVAIDLPGIGGSTRGSTGRTKRAIAHVVHDLVDVLAPHDVTLVGHDIGGMVTYAYLREFADLPRAVILDVPVPGVDPWDEFVRLPALWHFAFHAIPELPETVVTGHEADYFDYFYRLLSAHEDRPSAQSRAEQVAAYSTRAALTTGFDWYRAFPADVDDNRRPIDVPATPLLYVRGGRERGGDSDTYANGFRAAGVRDVHTAVIKGAGHFLPEEAPAETWQLITQFATGES